MARSWDDGVMPGSDEAEQALALAEAAFGRQAIEEAVAHLSAAIRDFTAADERCRAAMACVRLGEALAFGLGNLTASRAWFARARRLVEDLPACLEQGWVAVAAMGCDVDDPAELLTAAELALNRARRFGDVNLETKALADAGLAHVQAGRVAQGMTLLDEAMALACGPADDTYTAGKSVCSFFTACYHATAFEKAASWANLLRQHGLLGQATPAAVVLTNHCDSVQASLLMELGRWNDAEALLVRARVAFEAAVQGPSWHPDIALADLRIRQGRLPEAETLLLGKDQAMQALLPAARLHLARGDHNLARATAVRGLRAVRGDRLRAVELLTVLVDAELAAGDVPAAEKAAAELVNRTADVPVPALLARAATARARVILASGAAEAAVAALETAIDQVDARQLPWLHATLLLDLARARERAGNRIGAALDAKAAAVVVLPVAVGASSRERDAERPALTGVEGVHLAGHAGRDHPALDRPGVEERAVDRRPRRVHPPADPRRAHAPRLTCALPARDAGGHLSRCDVRATLSRRSSVRQRGSAWYARERAGDPRASDEARRASRPTSSSRPASSALRSPRSPRARHRAPSTRQARSHDSRH